MKKFLNFILFFFIVCFLISLFKNLNEYNQKQELEDDISQDYHASYMLLNKQSIYNILKNNFFIEYAKSKNYKFPINEIVNNYHPPFVAIIFAPFVSFLSYKAFTFLILFLICALSSISFYLLYKKFNFNTSFFLFFLLIILTSTPFSCLTNLRNIDFIIFTLISILFLLEFKKESIKKDYLIAFLLSLATFIKIFPLCLIFYYALNKRKKVILGFLLFSIINLFITVYFVEINDIVLYLTSVTKKQIILFDGPSNFSCLAFYRNIFSKLGHDTTSLPYIFYIIEACLIFVVNILLSIKLFKINKKDICFSLWILPFILCSPISWEYYLIYLLIPIMTLFYYKKINTYILANETLLILYINYLFPPFNFPLLRHFIVLLVYFFLIITSIRLIRENEN